MLCVELSPLTCVKWFQPVGSRLELIIDNIRQNSCEGITKEDILLLRKMNNNVANLPEEMRNFLIAIGDYLFSKNASIERIEPIKPAIHALAWSVVMEYKISNHYSKLLCELWVDIYGYGCPFDFV
jgi:hypothetical protein